jgi:hypothetical protein
MENGKFFTEYWGLTEFLKTPIPGKAQKKRIRYSLGSRHALDYSYIFILEFHHG